jgi:anti-anti-sigma factor
MTEATVQVDHNGDGGVRITVAGELDMDNAASIEQQILAAISNQLTSVTLDLSGLDFIDSAGLRVLFTLGTRLAILQIAFQLVVPPESPIRRMVDVSGLSGTVRIASN